MSVHCAYLTMCHQFSAYCMCAGICLTVKNLCWPSNS